MALDYGQTVGESITASQAKKDPVSSAIANYAARLAERADSLAGKVHEKLSPVMIPNPPAGEPGKTMAIEVYPPLFEDLREKFIVIERALRSIEEAVSRTEL